MVARSLATGFVVASLGAVTLVRAGEDPPVAAATSPAAAGGPFGAAGLAAWRTASGQPVTSGWEVVDGVWHLTPDPPSQGGRRRVNHTIITAEEVGDFSLQFEWRITRGGNGGIKYRVRSYGSRWLGCEYQILDDPGSNRVPPPRQSAAALYGLYAPPADKPLRPAPEWNLARIVVRGERIEHWLNGRLVVAATAGDTDWDQRVVDSKFDEFAGFGRNRRGRLMLTDHGAETWLRGIAFEPLDERREEP